jgi:hypothetical protein
MSHNVTTIVVGMPTKRGEPLPPPDKRKFTKLYLFWERQPDGTILFKSCTPGEFKMQSKALGIHGALNEARRAYEAELDVRLNGPPEEKHEEDQSDKPRPLPATTDSHQAPPPSDTDKGVDLSDTSPAEDSAVTAGAPRSVREAPPPPPFPADGKAALIEGSQPNE